MRAVVRGPKGAGKTTVTARLREELLARGNGIAFETVLSTAASSVDAAEARLCAQWVSDAVGPLERDPQFVDLRAA